MFLNVIKLSVHLWLPHQFAILDVRIPYFVKCFAYKVLQLCISKLSVFFKKRHKVSLNFIIVLLLLPFQSSPKYLEE